MMKVREVFEKFHFLGKQLNRPIWCFSWVFVVYLLYATTPAVTGRTFFDIVLDVLFCAIPIVMLPVILWGNFLQKVFAYLISALPIGILLVMLFEALFDPF